MLKRELKSNLKSFIIWALIMVLTFVVVFLIYPSLMESNQQVLDEMLASMPKEMLAIFNMDKVSLSTVFGWLTTEGYMMITLLVSCYAAILGSTILVKEIDDKTIEYLYSKPISRSKIYNVKITTCVIYILLINICMGITTLVGLLLSNDFVFIKWLLLTLLPILLHLFIFFISLAISNYFKKTRKSIAITLGITIGFYVLNVLGLMSEKIEFLKYLSPFTYVDSNMIINSEINYLYLGVLFIGTIISYVVSKLKFNKMEF